MGPRQPPRQRPQRLLITVGEEVAQHQDDGASLENARGVFERAAQVGARRRGFVDVQVADEPQHVRSTFARWDEALDLSGEQRQPDALAELGALTQFREANIIKLPNISETPVEPPKK